ncbi:MAG: hypothetical protein JXR96_17290 [Deltaproteobacteria bacterium]|nr:hypothetical protein [Deltaproteobacteria bacterium]
MTREPFVDYSGAAPILLPSSIRHCWQGFYLPADPDDDLPDLELPEGGYRICDDFDFENPKTDYDRACALGSKPAVQRISVGPGEALVFATELDPLTWWAERCMIVNGACLPDPALLEKVEWQDALVWTTGEPDLVLMNACYHGGDPELEDFFAIEIPAGEYRVQSGRYGWADDDPSLLLFRFVPA